MREFDPCEFTERAAIYEFDAGMTRFRAETKAAADQNTTRWEALRHEADSIGDTAGGGHHRPLACGQPADHLPAMQPASAEENGPLPEREFPAGRPGLALLALPVRGGI